QEEEPLVVELAEAEFRLPEERSAFVGTDERSRMPVAAVAPPARSIVGEPAAVLDHEIGPPPHHLQPLERRRSRAARSQVERADRATPEAEAHREPAVGRLPLIGEPLDRAGDPLE